MSGNGSEGPEVSNTGGSAGEPARPDTDLPTVSDTGNHGPQSGEWAARLPVPGQTWGRYLIEKQLGSGGQALVFQAFDRFGVAGHVVLKVPRRPVPPAADQAWSSSETEPLAKLDHSNIVRVLDAGCVDGVPYVATELVEGLPLDEHVKNHSLAHNGTALADPTGQRAGPRSRPGGYSPGHQAAKHRHHIQGSPADRRFRDRLACERLPAGTRRQFVRHAAVHASRAGSW